MKRPFLVMSLILVACGARTATSTGVHDDAAVTPDAGGVSLAISSVGLSQDCMPVTAPDPLNVGGTLAIDNPTNTTIGPLTITSGQVLDGSTVIATFAVSDPAVAALGPESTTTVPFSKQGQSLSPQNGCYVAKCGGSYSVALVLSGTGIAPGTRALSTTTKVTCTE